MFDQVKTILWVKWRLFMNGLNAGKAFAKVVSVMVAVAAMFIAAIVGVGMLVVGATMPDDTPGTVILGAGDVCVLIFLFFVVMGIMMELQRSDVVDLRRLLHMPVSLRMLFGINYFFSCASLLLPFFVFPAIGAIIGLTISRGPHMLLILPAAFAFYYMVSAADYCFRGLITSLLQDKRKRQMVIAGMGLLFGLSFQIPNLLFRLSLRNEVHHMAADMTDMAAPEPSSMLPLLNTVIPLGWFPLSVTSLAESRVGAALACMAGMVLLGTVFLAVAYRSTIRFYMGKTWVVWWKRKARKRLAQQKAAQIRIEQDVPFCDDELSSAIMMSWVSTTRHPMVRIQMFSLILISLCMVAFLVFSLDGAQESLLVQCLVLTGATLIPFVFLGALPFNIFGMDLDGFRAFVLLPTPRHRYLLAKNIAFLPLMGGIAFLLCLVVNVILGLSPLQLLTTLPFIVTFHLLFAMMGNVTSIYFPMPMRPDVFRKKKMQWIQILAGFAIMFTLPLCGLLLLAALMADEMMNHLFGLQTGVIGLALSVALCSLVILLYRYSLPGLGRLLERREQLVLEKVSWGDE